jgi:PAS domain S-box-containing protein
VLPSFDFRPLFEDNPNPIVVFDRETRELLAVNDAACRHFGYERGELIGRDVSTLRPPEDAERMRAEYAHSRATVRHDGPMQFPGQWRHQRKDGSVVTVEIWRMRIDFEGRPAVMGVIQDVTARLDAERELRDSEERYRLLFEAAPVPIFVFDSESLRFLAFNQAAIRTYGYSRDELRSMTVLDIRPPEDLPEVRALIDSVDVGPPTTYVCRHRKRDGTVFEVELTRHAIQFAGRPARLVVASDVTERRRVEEQLRQSQKMEAAGLLAGGVAHDFNNLLGLVVAASELAKRAARAGRPVEGYLADIQGAAIRAGDLTRKLLAFSRKQVLHVRTLDLSDAVEDFVQLVRRVIGEDVELVVRRAPEPLLVSADVSQLEQVLLNLCTNARQAMPSGGCIAIETRLTRFERSSAEREPWAAPGDWAEVRIDDDGVGMDAITRARIFEPFFTTKSEGTGLGLAMVHGIVHQHRGLLHVESRPGAGTTVRVCLPIVDETADEAGEDARGSDPPVQGGRETVLLAEDEAALREMLTNTLTELGYDVVTARDGEEAERELRERRGEIALALLDVVMPRLSGVEAYARMRALDPSLKVVFMTGYAPENARVSDVLAHGGHTLLAKPFALRDLGRIVRDTLDGKS